jgi:hypothetical protein
VAAVAVQDNPDAPRVDLAVADDLLVPGAAADDLANLLAELVDNAIAFSAPETRVLVGGQEVGSGYVLEVEDQGLGMADGELEAVNRRLAGNPAAGGDPEQGPGASQQLPKRAPHASLAPGLAAAGQPGQPGQPGDPGNRPARSPEAVRSMLTRYRSGLECGRAAAARDLPDDPLG